jgi:hypothetical protein
MKLSHKQRREDKMKVSHTIVYRDKYGEENEIIIHTGIKFLIREINKTVRDIMIQDEHNRIVSGDRIFTNK